MKNPFEDHADGLGELEAELGAECPTFTWAGKDWTVLPGGAMRRKPIDAGGFTVESDLQLTVRVWQFLSLYQSAEALREQLLNTDFEYGGHRYTVETVTVAPGGHQIQIGANDGEQGA